MFELVGTLLLDGFFPYNDLDDQLLRRFGDVDHRKYLMIQLWTFKEHSYSSGSTLSFDCVIKNVQGTIICWIERWRMFSFDVEIFRKVGLVSTLHQG